MMGLGLPRIGDGVPRRPADEREGLPEHLTRLYALCREHLFAWRLYAVRERGVG